MLFYAKITKITKCLKRKIMKQNFRTSEVGKFLHVRSATVVNWINYGKLPAYETLGGHYRIMREDLINFIKKRNIPLPYELQSDKHKILIVDDDESVVESVELILENIGIEIEIESAHNGIEAGIKLVRFIPDLVVLDAVMPGADGAAVCRIIKQYELLKNVKILVFTGYPQKGEELIKLGADRVVEKSSPDCLTIFQKEVRRLLGIKYKKVSAKFL